MASPVDRFKSPSNQKVVSTASCTGTGIVSAPDSLLRLSRTLAWALQKCQQRGCAQLRAHRNFNQQHVALCTRIP